MLFTSRDLIKATLFVGAFEGVSALIGRATQAGVDQWYAGLTRPLLTPPNIVFPIMWTILYALIAIAGYLIWKNRAQTDGMKRLYVFCFYAAANWSWSFIFFKFYQLRAAFVWIIAVDILAACVIALSWKELRAAAYLMLPPFLWTLFATYLAGGFWLLNR